jgi:peptidoglycan/xylan/chitin deacetylase (PgdA/CDA1 family)
VRRTYAEGHLIANHTSTHPEFLDLEDQLVSQELRDTNTAIRKAIGIYPTYFRPPYGETSDRVNQLAEQLTTADQQGNPIATPLTPILWSVDTHDGED